jgi:alanyl-tRNA synthetase
MTDRIYYKNSFLYDFVAALIERRTLPDGRTALVLDRTAFYPTSGGQVFDTGWLELEPLEGERGQFLPKLHVIDVLEDQAGEVLHVLESPDGLTDSPTRVRGFIDVERRRDHMQQHSGQHVISAAFVELFQMPTVSFHMGDETCTIDLETKSISAEQIAQAERRSNQIIWEDRSVSMQLASEEEARSMGVRKIPAAEHEKLRLIEIKDFDLCACGGTHVKSTGQIGSILIRKTEKVKQGFRVEFVCGTRAISHARKDFETLTAAAALFSSHLWDVPVQVSKLMDENRTAAKQVHHTNEEVAELLAVQTISNAGVEEGIKLIVRLLPERDLAFTKLFAQKLTSQAGDCVVLLAAGAGQPALVFAQSPGLPHDMGALMKQAMSLLGGRGGGSHDLAQGGVPDPARTQEALEFAKVQLLERLAK